MYIKNKPHILMFFTICIVVLLAGCTSTQSAKRDNPFDANVNIQIGPNGRIAKVFDTFNGVERSALNADSGQRISIDYKATLYKGSLVIQCLDPNGIVIWEKSLSESDHGTGEITSESPGSYKLTIQGHHAEGNFNVAWDVE